MDVIPQNSFVGIVEEQNLRNMQQASLLLVALFFLTKNSLSMLRCKKYIIIDGEHT